MNNRLKQLRSDLKLTQDDFAARISVTKSSISLMERGERNPSPQTIQLICQQFHVRREWLVEGTGPMYMETTDDDVLIDQVLFASDPFVKAFVKGIAKTPGGWEALRQIVEAVHEELQKEEDQS
jgi:transcriptional regulator with XRE-family HTH domain